MRTSERVALVLTTRKGREARGAGRVRATVLIGLAVAGCGRAAQQSGNEPESRLVANEDAANAQPADDGHIPCATGGAATLTRSCTVDRETTPRGLALTLHHADGGFHRLLVTTDGRGVIAADGAQGAKVTVVGPDQIEVKIGTDRYRLPATVGKRRA